jgi:hypothetical protein
MTAVALSSVLDQQLSCRHVFRRSACAEMHAVSNAKYVMLLELSQCSIPSSDQLVVRIGGFWRFVVTPALRIRDKLVRILQARSIFQYVGVNI